ncbi:MAG: hypothetical protein ACKO9Z_05215, partial [Planctomycetota bacterium]
MSEFFLSRGGKTSGPFTMEQIKGFSESGKLLDTDLIRKNQGPWQPVTQVKGLKVNSASPSTVRSQVMPPPLQPTSQPVSQSTNSLPPNMDSTPKSKSSGSRLLTVGFFILLLALGGIGAYLYSKGGGTLLVIGFGGSNPYNDFASTYGANRKAEWDKLVAGKKVIGDLSGKALDELEKVFKKKANLKTLAETGPDIFKAIKTQGLAKLGKVVAGDDAIDLYTKVVAKTNEYFTSREAPKIATDSTSQEDMESRQAEEIRFNVLPFGYFDYFSFNDRPVEEIPAFMTIATEEERKGQIEYLLCLPIGLEGKGTVPPKVSDFAVEALDKDSKVIKQGRIYSKIPLLLGKVVEVKAYLSFANPQDVDRISKFVVVKKPDEAFLAFVGKLQKSLESGAVNEIRNLVRTMKPGWDKKFIEMADASLKDGKTTTRLGIVAGLDELLKRNIDA